MSELLKCPFCGGEADVMLSQSRWGQSYTIHHDTLRKCPAEYVGSMQFGTEAEAIAAWNSRAERVTDDEWESYQHGVPATEENMAKFGWVRERTCEYVGDEISGGCSECRGWLDPGCAYCPSCGAKVVGE